MDCDEMQNNLFAGRKELLDIMTKVIQLIHLFWKKKHVIGKHLV